MWLLFYYCSLYRQAMCFCSNLKIILFGGYISNINIYQALTSRSGMESCVLPHN